VGDLGSSAIQLVSSLLVFILGAIICLALRRAFYSSSSRVLLIYCWHSFFSVVSWLYITNFGGDAIAYFRHSLSADLQFSFGTGGIRFITSFLTQGP